MNRSLSPTNVERVLASVRTWGDAGTFPKIASTLQGGVPPRTLKRWLAQLVREGRLNRRGASTATRYSVSDPLRDNGGAPVGAVSPALSLSRAVGGELARDFAPPNGDPRVANNGASVSYDRADLDAYWPNETRYLTEPMRTKLLLRTRDALVPIGRVDSRDGGVPVPGMSPAPALAPEWQRFTADLVVWSRAAQPALGLVARRHRRLTAPSIVAAVVARADVPTMAGELRRIWNHRDAVALLASPDRVPALTLEAVAAVQAALTRSPAPLPTSGAAIASVPVAVVTRGSRPVCRDEPLLLSGTAYHPSSEAALIEPCLRQIVLTAGAILDPAEASFFVFAHLLRLLPFAVENLSAAVLVANLLLVRAQLAPVSLATVPPADFRAAVIAWWELRRPDYLARLWTRAARPAVA